MTFFSALATPRRSAALVMAAMLLGGCVTDGTPPAMSGPAPAASGSARSIAITTTPPEPADFVRAARPASDPDFIPVGATPPARTTPPRDADAVKRLETELDADRRRSRGFANRPRPAASYDGKIPPRPRAEPPKQEE